MVKIKLTRVGKKHEPRFRIVAVEGKSKATGQYIEKVGHYNPISKELSLDKKLYDKWLSQGAQPTPTVASLVKRMQA